MHPLCLATERLELQPLSPDSLDAFVAGDVDRLRALTGAAFPVPLVPPPLMDDVLAFFRDRLRAHPDTGMGRDPEMGEVLVYSCAGGTAASPGAVE